VPEKARVEANAAASKRSMCHVGELRMRLSIPKALYVRSDSEKRATVARLAPLLHAHAPRLKEV
jgi:hypothetical protein